MQRGFTTNGPEGKVTRHSSRSYGIWAYLDRISRARSKGSEREIHRAAVIKTGLRSGAWLPLEKKVLSESCDARIKCRIRAYLIVTVRSSLPESLLTQSILCLLNFYLVLNNHLIGFHIRVPSKKKAVPFPSLTLHQPPRAATASVSASEPALLVRPVATVAFTVTSRGREAKLSLWESNCCSTLNTLHCPISLPLFPITPPRCPPQSLRTSLTQSQTRSRLSVRGSYTCLMCHCANIDCDRKWRIPRRAR